MSPRKSPQKSAYRNIVRYGGVNKVSPPRARLHDLDFDACKGVENALVMARRYKSNVKAVFKDAVAATEAGDADDAVAEASKVMTLCERLAEQAQGMTTLVRELEDEVIEVPRGLVGLPISDVLALLDMDDMADIAEMLEGVIQQFLF